MRKAVLVAGILLFIVSGISAQKHSKIVRLPTDANIVYDICYTAGGSLLAVADSSNVKVFGSASLDLLKTFTNGHKKQILSIDVSRDSNLLVSGGKDSTVVLWDFKDGRLLKRLHYDGLVTAVCLSPDNRFMAWGGTDNKVYVYDIAQSTIVNTFAEHTNEVTSLAWSPDGRYLATAGADKFIYLYADGALQSRLWGHKNWIHDMVFHAVNSTLVSCGYDGRIFFWSLADIKKPKVASFDKYRPGWIMGVDYHQDGETWVFADFKGKIDIRGKDVKYRKNIGAPVHKVLFKPNEGVFIKLAVASRGKGVLLIDGEGLR